MITIVNYGSGNIKAITNIYERLGVPHKVASDPDQLAGASKIILPGVGAFDQAMGQLEHSGMRGVLDELVLRQGLPILGICVGMQLLAQGSDEGKMSGLGWVTGRVRLFDVSTLEYGTRLPHMGWNDVQSRPAEMLFRGLETAARFYFLHSFYFDCADPGEVLAVSTYGRPFACAVRRKNIYGVQFHPEKSHRFGVQLLKNFSEIE